MTSDDEHTCTKRLDTPEARYWKVMRRGTHWILSHGGNPATSRVKISYCPWCTKELPELPEPIPWWRDEKNRILKVGAPGHDIYAIILDGIYVYALVFRDVGKLGRLDLMLKMGEAYAGDVTEKS